MAADRTRQILLGGLALGLAFAIYRVWAPTSVVPLPASNLTATATARANQQAPPAAATAPDVHLERLEAERPKAGGGDRGFFPVQAETAAAATARAAACARRTTGRGAQRSAAAAAGAA